MMLGLLLVLSLVEFAGGFRVVCYYTNTAQYRPVGGTFLAEDILSTQCTHIVYAFATPLGLGMEATQDNEKPKPGQKGMYERVMQIKQQNEDMKVLLVVAGPNSDTHPFTAIIATPTSRSGFAQNAVMFLRKNLFDGLVVSWRYPISHERPVLNIERFVLLFKELRDAFTVDSVMRSAPSLLLGAVVPGIQDDIESGYDIEGIAEVIFTGSTSVHRYTDFISLVTYDYHYKWDNTVKLSIPFHSSLDDPLSLDATLRFLKTTKIPKEKINLGINLAAKTFTLKEANASTIGSTATGPGEPGHYTQTKGMLAYYEVCLLIKSGAVVTDQPTQDIRTLVKGYLWATYEDVLSVIAKTCYVLDNEFGGVMVQSLDLDDFTGDFCGQGKYPLITAIASVVRDNSCRVYEPAQHAHGGQSQIMNNSTGWRCLLAGLVLLGLSFNCNQY